MKFDVYFPIVTKSKQLRPGVKPKAMEWSEIKHAMAEPSYLALIEQVRAGNKEKKYELPAVCFVGRCTLTRADTNMIPTQVVMLDVDHCEKALESGEMIIQSLKEKSVNDEAWKKILESVLLIAITPSGKGLRILCTALDEFEGCNNILNQMNKWNELLELEKYGKYDQPCHDYARISFFFNPNEIIYESEKMNGELPQDSILVNSVYDPEKSKKTTTGDGKAKVVATPTEGMIFKTGDISPFTDEEKGKFDNFEYRGTLVRLIIEKYVEVNGSPSSGEIHNYYNEMVKNFRCICDNNKRLLLYLLPRFGHTVEECYSQINSICRVNTLSSLPKPFYFFLKDYGFYKAREGASKEGMLREYMMSEEEAKDSRPPYLPPVFKQLVSIAPPDFIEPAINALMPILGTLTSYAQAKYPYDDRMHTTSFFSIIYAPPGTGKGFVERFMGLLFEDLRIRDFVQSERENVYLRILNRKGANDKSPDQPHTSLRLIPPKNSEAEFLQKQRDNHGYHMFTYAAEMDSWAKGVKAAGGNKDDMIRIAWDNGEYGQQFKSASTFKGTVNLYWNVLITGTLQQVESYFRNVENGLVTRCCFTSIDNQEFALPAKWKELTPRNKEVVKRFAEWCDSQTYEEPCTICPDDLLDVADENFDKEVDWRFKFRERQTFDCSWIMPTIDKFHNEQMAKAALDVDKARDVFRRRVGVRGFRLALMCMCFWKKPNKRELDKCATFVDWWMHRDIENMLKLWGAKYNEQADTAPKLVQRTVFDQMPQTFGRSDVYIVCTKQGIKTPVRRIIFDWKKLGYIEQIDKDTFKKKKNE